MARMFQHVKQFYSSNKSFRYYAKGIVPYFVALNALCAYGVADEYIKECKRFDITRSDDEMFRKMCYRMDLNYWNSISRSTVWPAHLTMFTILNGIIVIKANHEHEDKE
jgi:hypothetical protein